MWEFWESQGHDVDSEEVPGIVVLEGRHRTEYILKKAEDDKKRWEDPSKYWIKGVMLGKIENENSTLSKV
tara:strand:+ start:454 stop:663 length:210 start_codon:yes stop_codon:yes gene_type:complete